MSATDDLDALARERVDDVFEEIEETGEFYLDNLFASERVIETVENAKILMTTYNKDKILSYLPYTKNLYVCVCPMCALGDVESLKTFVERSAIVPALTAPYRYYDDKILNIVRDRDHLSSYEYHGYRSIELRGGANGGICAHCLEKRIKSTERYINKLPQGKEKFKYNFYHAVGSLSPFIYPDYELIDAFHKAYKDKDFEGIENLESMCDVISKIRSAQAYNSPILVDSANLAGLPEGINDEADMAITSSLELDRQVGEGLGLRIPVGIGLEPYIEICSDYRDRIAKLIKRIERNTKTGAPLARSELHKEIMKLNSEVERIKNSGKYIILSSALEFYQNNHALVNAILLAGIAGLGTGLEGCAGTLAASGALKVAQKKGWISTGAYSERLRRLVESGVQPAIDNLIATYVGSSSSAVSIISIQKSVEKAAQA